MNIAIITGSRADYGLLFHTIKKIQESKNFQLKLIVTGQHLEKKFGNTFMQIEKDRVKVFKKIKLKNSGNSKSSIVQNISYLINKFESLFKNKRFDYIIVLGDRFEIFASAVSAAYFKIPIIHIHGGEVTESSYDDYNRHAISKFASIHFVSNKVYKNRLINMGEIPKNIFICGAAGLEYIKKLNFLKRKQVYNLLKLKLYEKYSVISFHPSLEINYLSQLKNLFKVASTYKDHKYFISMPNLDINFKNIDDYIKSFCKKNNNFIYKKSFGSKEFLSVLKYSQGMIGNSSSGIIEAPSLKIPTINIGNRQKGRLKSKSVVNSDGSLKSLKKSFKIIKKMNFSKNSKIFRNPYDNNKYLSEYLVQVISKINKKNLLPKKFYDR